MSKQKSAHRSPIKIESLSELKKRERAIVRRINATPNGGRLFLADPIRLLKEINVHLTSATRRALIARLGADDLASNPLRHLYDDFKNDASDPSVSVVIRGILPKEGRRHA